MAIYLWFTISDVRNEQTVAADTNLNCSKD